MALGFEQADKYQQAHSVWVKMVCTGVLLLMFATGCERFQSADSQIEKATTELDKKDFGAAAIHLKNALQKEPENARARYMLGKAYMARAEIANAIKELKRAQELKYDPNLVLPPLSKALLLSANLAELNKIDAQLATDVKARAEIIGTQGDGLLALAKGKEARLLYTDALKLNPDSVTAQFGMARLTAMTGQLSEADAIAENILKHSPQMIEVILFRSDLQKIRGNRAAAIESVQKGLEVDATDVRLHMALGTLYLENKQPGEALKQSEEIKKHTPNSMFGPYLRALVEVHNKNLRVAQEEIQKAIKLAPNYPPALLLGATIELALNSTAQAEQYVKTALDVVPNHPIAMRLMAQVHMRSGRPANAVDLLKQLLEKNPGNSELNGLIGEAYFQSGDMENANKYFALAAKSEESSGRALTGLAMTQVASGNLDQAVIALESALKQQDTGIQTDLMLIGARIQQRQFDKASEAIDALEKKMSGSAVPLGLRANLALAKGETPKAYTLLEEALKVDPKYFPALRLLARLDQAAGKIPEAQKRLEEFNKRNDKHPEALLALAEIRTIANAPVDEVIAIIRRAQAADPKKTQATEVLARLLIVQGRPNEALEVVQQGLSSNLDVPALIDLLGTAQMNLNRPADAVASYVRLTTLQPRNDAAWSKLAQVQNAAGDKNAAITSIKRALALNPKNLSLLETAVGLHLANKNYPEAQAIARDVQKNLPKSPAGFALEGEVLVAQKQYAEAVGRYDQALKMQPNPSLFVHKHAALKLAQRTVEADKSLVDWLHQYPKDVPVRMYAADVALKDKKPDTAIVYYKEVLGVQADNVTALNNLAWVLNDKNDPAALQYIEAALRLQPNQAVFMDTYGAILAKQGKLDAALAQMKRATELMPNQAVFHLNYARALLKAGKKSEAKRELEILRRQGTSENKDVQALAQELG